MAIRRVRGIAEKLGVPMADVALAWLLAQPAVTTVIAGMRNAEQAKENARAADLELPGDVVAELSEVTQALRDKLGANADMWQTDSRIA